MVTQSYENYLNNQNFHLSDYSQSTDELDSRDKEKTFRSAKKPSEGKDLNRYPTVSSLQKGGSNYAL